MVRGVEQALRCDLGYGVGTRRQCVKLAYVVEDGSSQDVGKREAGLRRET